MWTEVFNLAIKNGLWAVLFTGLLIFVIKDSTKREKKYQDIIKELSDSLQIVKDIKENVDEIKTFVYSKKTYTKKKSENKKNKEEKNEKQI